jgi:hypothetical protein
MTDLLPIADEAAVRLSFCLMRNAYLDLARMLRSIDEDAARELLQAVEYQIEYRLGSSAKDAPGETPQETSLAAAAGRACSAKHWRTEAAAAMSGRFTASHRNRPRGRHPHAARGISTPRSV